jgi:hypothetical protein
MIEAYTGVSRSGSVARPIMKDSHSFDLGSNPNRSMITEEKAKWEELADDASVLLN